MGGCALISHKEFRAGFNIWPFKIVPQQDLLTDASALNEGVLDLRLTFSAVTAQNIDLIVLAKYNGLITIDKNRVVKVDNRT